MPKRERERKISCNVISVRQAYKKSLLALGDKLALAKMLMLTVFYIHSLWFFDFSFGIAKKSSKRNVRWCEMIRDCMCGLTLTKAAVLREWFPLITLLVSMASWFTVCKRQGYMKEMALWLLSLNAEMPNTGLHEWVAPGQAPGYRRWL